MPYSAACLGTVHHGTPVWNVNVLLQEFRKSHVERALLLMFCAVLGFGRSPNAPLPIPFQAYVFYQPGGQGVCHPPPPLHFKDLCFTFTIMFFSASFAQWGQLNCFIGTSQKKIEPAVISCHVGAYVEETNRPSKRCCSTCSHLFPL